MFSFLALFIMILKLAISRRAPSDHPTMFGYVFFNEILITNGFRFLTTTEIGREEEIGREKLQGISSSSVLSA
jgi:hypothetical protein